jgi:hypothetical protein
MAFRFKLELEDGSPADPPTLHAAVPNWQAGDTIWAVKREIFALCGHFSSNLRYFVGNLRARRVKMLSRQ